MHRSKVPLSVAAKAAAARLFPGALPMTAQAKRLTGMLRTGFDFRPERVALATSMDPTAPFPSEDIGASVAKALSVGSSQLEAMPLGGLGGLPFVGKAGWGLFWNRALEAGRSDLLMVYGCSTDVDASGEVGGGHASSAAAAFAVVERAGGISGLSDDLLRDRNDVQHAALLLELCRAYEPELAPHPDPRAKLPFVQFSAVQGRLREVVDWGGFRGDGPRLAALGGITLHVHGSGEPSFLPLAFEVFDPAEGALHDILADEFEQGPSGGDGYDDDGDGSDVNSSAGNKWGESETPTGPPLPVRLHHKLLFPLDMGGGEQI